jgi:signal transduction histidine kinase
MPPNIVGDETRLTQILLNLTDNAIKYTERGSVHTSIETTKKDNWHMVVRDTGRGIHEGDLEIIFQEFRRAEAASASGIGGTGLGLAITRHLVDMMNGEIHVTSRIGKGSTFEVVLPLVTVNEAANNEVISVETG